MFGSETGGAKSLFTRPKEEGIIPMFSLDEHMSFNRFKIIREHWVSQFADETKRSTDLWWRVNRLVTGFNQNRAQTIASSRIKVLDESMSAFRPQTTKTGNLPHLSFIFRKPEPLGTELKTVASKKNNGPIIFAEIQEGKMPMKAKE